MTLDQFTDWQRRQTVRHELVEGVPVMMAGGTRAHDRIQRNLITRLTERLRGTPCEPLGPDMMVRTGTGNGRYPDTTIDCGPYEATALFAAEPAVVFEILSESNRPQDLIAKLRDYDATREIRHYILISQHEVLVFVYSRAANGSFSLHPLELRGLDKVIEIPFPALSLPVTDIYEGVGFQTG